KSAKRSILQRLQERRKVYFGDAAAYKRHILQQIFLNLQMLFIGESLDAPHHDVTKSDCLRGKSNGRAPHSRKGDKGHARQAQNEREDQHDKNSTSDKEETDAFFWEPSRRAPAGRDGARLHPCLCGQRLQQRRSSGCLRVLYRLYRDK